jgi:hypothetical protein
MEASSGKEPSQCNLWVPFDPRGKLTGCLLPRAAKKQDRKTETRSQIVDYEDSMSLRNVDIYPQVYRALKFYKPT